MARSMFKAKCMPNAFWRKVVTCTVYILNMCPNKNSKYHDFRKGMDWQETEGESLKNLWFTLLCSCI